MSFVDVLREIDTKSGFLTLLSYIALKDIFTKEPEDIEEANRIRQHRHQRRQNRLRLEEEKEKIKAAAEAETAPAHKHASDSAGGADAEAVDEGVAATASAPAQPPAERDGAASEEEEEKGTASAAKEADRSSDARGRANRVKKTTRKKTSKTETDSRARKRSTKQRTTRQKRSATKDNSTAAAAATSPAEEVDNDVEPYATHPLKLATDSDASPELARKLQQQANELMEKALMIYDEDRSAAIFYLSAVTLRRLEESVGEVLALQTVIREKQEEALRSRVGLPPLPRDPPAAAEPEPVPAPSKSRAESDGLADRVGELVADDSGHASETGAGDVDVEERGSDGADSPAQARGADAAADASSSASDEDPDERTVDLSDYADNYIALLRSYELLTLVVLSGSMPVTTFLSAMDGFFDLLAAFSVKPTPIPALYAVQSKAQFLQASVAWREGKHSLASFIGAMRRLAETAVPRAESGDDVHDEGTAAANARAEKSGSASSLWKRSSASEVARIMRELSRPQTTWANTEFAKALHILARSNTTVTTTSASASASTTAVAATRAEKPTAAQARALESAALLEPLLPRPGPSCFDNKEPCCLLAPRELRKELDVIARWLLLDTTVVKLNASSDASTAPSSPSPRVSAKDAVGPGAAEPTAAELAPGETTDPSAGTLTFVHAERGAVHLCFRNPLAFSNFSVTTFGGYGCDACNLARMDAGFEAFVLEKIQDERHYNKHARTSYGYTVCLPCAMYACRAAMVRLATALHPDPRVRVPFSCGVGSRLLVRAVRAGYAPPAAGGGNARDATVIIHVDVAVSPFAAWPTAWVIPPAAQDAMGEAFVPSAVGSGGDGSSTKRARKPPTAAGSARREKKKQATASGSPRTARGVEEGAAGRGVRSMTLDRILLQEKHRRALAVPSPDDFFHAPSSCSVATLSSVCGQDAEGSAAGGDGAEQQQEECPMCLLPLRGAEPVLRTNCGHLFHYACITAFYDGTSAEESSASDATGAAAAAADTPAAAEERPAEINDPQLRTEEGEGETSVEGDGEMSAAPAAHTSAASCCPLCRAVNFMPVLDEATTLEKNAYRLSITVPERDAAGCANMNPDGTLTLAVATMLPHDRQYHNPTSVAACVCLQVALVAAPPTRHAAPAASLTARVIAPPRKVPRPSTHAVVAVV